MRQSRRSWATPALLLALGLVLGTSLACSARSPRVHTLGFLGDYAGLAPGHRGQASLIFIDEEADFAGYSALRIEPVIAWAWPDGDPAEVTASLAQALDAALRLELGREFELVDEPRGGTLRLRTALASKGETHLVLEAELLDSATGSRLVAAVDDRDLDASEGAGSAREQTERWAIRIRDRLATFKQFDEAARARRATEVP
ncbi:MAG: DUF3313 domain-containing protein [Deltaproteobacteria bacterium]|nr:DUF3313 domain-containing protein [Deltaproteobacteria bacterium]MBW2500363.1 DUF3313 domain-containing protein [Deltaproteobacteria bacterium]